MRLAPFARPCASWPRGWHSAGGTVCRRPTPAFGARSTDVGFGPKLKLWHRVGEGCIGKIVGSASTLTADVDGRLQIVTKPPGAFAGRRGGFCPLPWGDQRETHWVLRSGPRQLGQWRDERRPLLADYRAAIGGTDRKRIVGVWRIANTAFQRGVGECRYRRIVVEDDHAPAVAFCRRLRDAAGRSMAPASTSAQAGGALR